MWEGDNGVPRRSWLPLGHPVSSCGERCEVRTLGLQGARKQEPGRSSPSTEFTEENLALPPSVWPLKASKWPASVPLMGATKASLHEVVETYWGDVGLRYLFPVSLNTWPVSKFRKSLLTVNPKRKSKIAWSMDLGIIPWWSLNCWLLTRDCLHHGHDQAQELQPLGASDGISSVTPSVLFLGLQDELSCKAGHLRPGRRWPSKKGVWTQANINVW